MAKIINRLDYIGQKINKLTIHSISKESRKVVTECECGNIKDILLYDIIRGHSVSCGCLTKAKVINRNTIHSLSNTHLYIVWKNIKKRCLNKKDNQYPDYGGRGITICTEWINDFKNFYDWCMNNGYEEGLYIDRKNNNGNYEPGNCRFVDSITNNNNKRSNVFLEFKGEKKTIAEWSRITGISGRNIHKRIFNRGWSVERALTTPITIITTPVS